VVISDYITPVKFTDPSGKFALVAFLLFVGISAILSAIDGGISAKINEQDLWRGFSAGLISGIAGGIICFLIPGAGALLGRAVNTDRIIWNSKRNLPKWKFK
jgi:uncharacterized membrane protein HdeD (DUF308 family)